MHGSRLGQRRTARQAIVGARPYRCQMLPCACRSPTCPRPRLHWHPPTSAGGAQDCSAHEQGAYTGEVSAGMLARVRLPLHALVGHSERRASTTAKVDAAGGATRRKAALARGITPIVCVGETLVQREAGETESVVKRQLSVVIHAAGALRRRDGRCLRARVGDRHRTHCVARAGAGRCITSLRSHSFGPPPSHAPSAMTLPVRRQRQARQRIDRSSPSPTSTADWSAAPR
jgi:hypothetical protein